MQTRSPASDFKIDIGAMAPVLLLLLAAANCFAVRIFEPATAGAPSGLAWGVSPFELITVFVAASLMAQHPATPWQPGWRELATAALLVVPSSAVAWAALGAYATANAIATTGRRRTGALIFAGLAAAGLWASVGLKLLAAPVTAAETALVHQLASMFAPDLVRTGNVIGTPGAHHLVILTACSSAAAVPLAVLATMACGLLAGASASRRLLAAGCVAGLLVAVANTARLALMSLSTDLYVFVHGGTGAAIYDLLQTGIVLASAYAASRRC